MRGSLAMASLAAVALAACFEPIDGGNCRSDRDCPDAVCSNVGECATATYRLRVAWTLDGATANQPGACDGVSELEVLVADGSTGEEFSTRPVPCAIGSILFDRMPSGYRSATVNAYGTRGELLDSARGSTDPSIGAISVDLQP
jgi:hypothetical protein